MVDNVDLVKIGIKSLAFSSSSCVCAMWHIGLVWADFMADGVGGFPSTNERPCVERRSARQLCFECSSHICIRAHPGIYHDSGQRM